MLDLRARDAALAAITALLNHGPKPGSLRITDTTGALLAVAQLAVPAFRPPQGGQTLSNDIGSAPITATGRAARFAFCDPAGVAVFSGSVGIPGSGADLIFPSVDWTRGEMLDLDPYTLALPA